MNKTKFFFEAGQVAIVLNAVVLLTLIGCGGNADESRIVDQAASPAVIPVRSPGVVDAPSLTVVDAASPAIMAQDDYVYYPSYGIYYGSNQRRYASLEGGAWVAHPAPRGVSVDALRASPSVKMDFHDSPANHHAAIAKKYPTSWKPADSK